MCEVEFLLYCGQNEDSCNCCVIYKDNDRVTDRSGLTCVDKMKPQTTDRLKLVAGTEALAATEIKDRAEFGKLLGALVPETWPPDNLRDALDYFYTLYKEHPEWEGWLTWYAVRIDSGQPILCGGVGFKGPPDKRGMVEIGYSVLPEFQGQGLATEMVAGIVQWAKQRPQVKHIEAETNIDNKASIRVLERNSFICAGAGLEPNTIRFLHRF
jgi:ribosomal-protein-alanine N-acetyltransferase